MVSTRCPMFVPTHANNAYVFYGVLSISFLLVHQVIEQLLHLYYVLFL